MSNTHKAPTAAAPATHATEKDDGHFNPTQNVVLSTFLERIETGLADALQKSTTVEEVVAEVIKYGPMRELLQNKTVPLGISMLVSAGITEVADRLKAPPAVVHGLYRVLETLGVGTTRGLTAKVRKMTQPEWEQHVDEHIRNVDIETPHPALSGKKPEFWRFSLDEEVHGPDGCKSSRTKREAFKVSAALNRDIAYRNQPRGNQRNAPPEPAAQKPAGEYPTETVTITEIRNGGLRLCPDCFPDGLPKEKPKEHKEHKKEAHKAEAEGGSSALTTLATRVRHAVGLVKGIFVDEVPAAAPPKDQSRVVDALTRAQAETDPEKQARAFLDAADLMDD